MNTWVLIALYITERIAGVILLAARIGRPDVTPDEIAKMIDAQASSAIRGAIIMCAVVIVDPVVRWLVTTIRGG